MELAVTIRDPSRRSEIFGPGDLNLRRLRERFGVKVHARHSLVRLVGEPAEVAQAAAALERLQDHVAGREPLTEDTLDDIIDAVAHTDGNSDVDSIRVFNREAVQPRTDGQRAYLQAMLDHDLVFCVGPAGTGKTYLAVSIAVHLLKIGRVKRIALVRPAVEAGEKLGFLPGDFQAKVNPYLRPLFDAMHDMMTYDQLKRFMVNDIVEVVPLAYMRGRTLNNSIIILDEAQNATPTQMLMFLTRLGQGSKMIVTGDDSQVDLDPRQPSGLTDAISRLQGAQGIAVLRLHERDIVRHRLVQEVVARYARLRPPTDNLVSESTTEDAAADARDSS